MPKRFQAVALLLLIASCAGPPWFVPPAYPPLEGIQQGDSADHVRQVLGKPNAWGDGWWRDGGVRYEQDFQVWFYVGKGRVVFDGTGHVVQSEADGRQPADVVPQSSNGLYRAD
jgi:hypothetical protein